MQTKTVKLQLPITVEGKEVHELTLHEPLLGDMEHVEMNQHGAPTNKGLIELVASLADIPPSSAKQIAMRDMEEIGRLIADFTESSPATGSG